MKKLTEEKKIKIGLVLNHVCTVLFVMFFLLTCVIVTVGLKTYLISLAVIVGLFTICSLISQRLLKDYKPK
ncbi:MAG: hypothetical protein K6G85_10580 [Eubacterium sp.]|nr:hypothetical protein [Eubacterium sp.]